MSQEGKSTHSKMGSTSTNVTVDRPAISAEESAKLALDVAGDGIANLAEMLGNLDVTVPSPDSDFLQHQRSLFDCLRAVHTAPKRDVAVEKLAHRIGFETPGATVRLAIGHRKIRKLFDARLGWLGVGNDVRVALEQLFEQSRTQRDEEIRKLRWVDGHWVIDLSGEQANQTCFLWIKPKSKAVADPGEKTAADAPSDRPLWLSQAAEVLGSALWCRPSLATPGPVQLFGRRPWMTILSVFLLISLVSAWPVHYPVHGVATVQPESQRMIAAPFEATLLQSHVKPGAEVNAGQVLLELDGRPLRLELESIAAEIQRTEKEETVALAGGDIAGAQQAGLENRRLSRRRDLLQDRLQKLTITSPIDGVVIAGDLRQYVGAPLKLGQSLLEVAPLDRVSVEVAIPEFEIGYVQPGSDTRIRFASVGGESHRDQLDQLYPSAQLRNDENVFVGELTIDNVAGRYRVGMEGDATVYGPLRPLVWSYVRRGWERCLWWIGY